VLGRRGGQTAKGADAFGALGPLTLTPITLSAAWRPRNKSGAHGFASPPHDGFAFVEDERFVTT